MLSFWVSVEVSLQKNWSSNSSTVSHYSFNHKFNSFNGNNLNWLGYYLIHGITLFKQGHLKLHLQTLTEALNIKEAFNYYPRLNFNMSSFQIRSCRLYALLWLVFLSQTTHSPCPLPLLSTSPTHKHPWSNSSPSPSTADHQSRALNRDMLPLIGHKEKDRGGKMLEIFCCH